MIGDGTTHPFDGFEIIDGVAETGSIRKIIGLENVLNFNKISSERFDFNTYYLDEGLNPSYSTFENINL